MGVDRVAADVDDDGRGFSRRPSALFSAIYRVVGQPSARVDAHALLTCSFGVVTDGAGTM